MRFDTHRARAHVVWQLLHTPGISDIHDDGTDIVVFRAGNGMRVMIHVVERLMPLNELRPLYKENSDAGIHTLLLLWADMLLPAHGQFYEPDEWMQALLQLQDDCIYGYEVFGEQVFLFGVHFRKRGWAREIVHGHSLDFRTLQTETVKCEWPPMLGTWLVARLSELHSSVKAEEPLHRDLSHLRSDFERLNLSGNANFAQVQHAYRVLARQYHPDNNTAADANERMKQLNASYSRIRRHFWGGETL